MIGQINTLEKGKSKYIKEPRINRIFYRCSILYIFALYVLPPYFGIPTPGFDLTALRIMTLVLMFFIFEDPIRVRAFIQMIKNEKVTPILAFFIFVLFYTMVLRADFNAFFNPFMELFQMYLLMYIIRDCVGINKTIKLVIGFIYLLIILGFVEAVIKVSPFVVLNTINKGTLYSGAFVRNGSYRIMSNGAHALGYGLLLVTAVPFAGIDIEKNEYNIFKRPFFLIGIIINVFLTGSRSSLGVMFVQLVFMFLLTEKKYIKANCVYLLLFCVALTLAVVATQSTPMGKYVMLQITSLIDTLFGTSFSLKYGADLTNLNSSSDYRGHLWRILLLDWLNPLVGRGSKSSFMTMLDDGSVVHSVDNNYVVMYIRYAYPGLISFCLYFIYMIVSMLIKLIKTKSAVVKMVLIGSVGYAVHLYVVEALMTLKYVYILFAIFMCLNLPEKEEVKSLYFGKRYSVYVKR